MLPSRQPKANPNIPKRTEANKTNQDISNLEAKDRRGGGAHGPPRNPQGSISRVLGTEETEDLPRLGNRPQDSRSKTKTERNLQPCGLWARLLAGLCLEHTILLYMIQRERKGEQTQPNTQKSGKTPTTSSRFLWAVFRGRPRGGGRAHILPFAAVSLRRRCTQVRTFLSEPGSGSKISRLGGWWCPSPNVQSPLQLQTATLARNDHIM